MVTYLTPEEYDISYFDGNIGPLSHNAGYGNYTRWFRTDGPNSSGEFWFDLSQNYINQYQFSGRLLELGSAKGFVVADFRSLSVDAYGIDVSQYAYDQADSAIQPYLTVGDIRTDLVQYANNQFDVVFSSRVLECFDPIDLPEILQQTKRISKQEIHLIDVMGNINYYNIQPLSWWATQGFAKGTVLVARQTGEQIEV